MKVGLMGLGMKVGLVARLVGGIGNGSDQSDD